MKLAIGITFVSFLLAGCVHKVSLPKSKVLANAFFNGKLPSEIPISEKRKGKPNDMYEVHRIDEVTSDGRRIKLFYTVNKDGRFGNMFIDGFKFNPGDNTSALTAEEYGNALMACDGEPVSCYEKVFQQLYADCRNAKTEGERQKYCWFCEQYGGPDRCNVL